MIANASYPARIGLDTLSSLSVQQLRYVAAVAKGATFADIANDLDVTQSALSQGLGRLEVLLGAKLVEPVGRRRRLTEIGQQVADYAALVLEATESLIDRVARYESGKSGRLRVGMVDAAALYLFDRAIAQFADQADIDLSLVVDGSDVLLERLTGFSDDLAVVIEPAVGFDSTPVASEELHLYGPQDPTNDSSWVLYPTGSHTRDLIDAGLSKMGLRPRAVIESGNPEVQRQLARLTNSSTVLPAQIAEQGRDRLTRRSEAVATRRFVVARRSGSEPSALATAFVELISG